MCDRGIHYLKTFQESVAVEELEADVFERMAVGGLVQLETVEVPVVNVLQLK